MRHISDLSLALACSRSILKHSRLTETFPAKEVTMSHAHHSTHEFKKKAAHTPKEKRALKLEKKRAAEHANPEIKIVKGTLNPPTAS